MDGDFVSRALDAPNWVEQSRRSRIVNVELSGRIPQFLQRDLNDEALRKPTEPVVGQVELTAARQQGFDNGYAAELAAAAGSQAAYRTAAEVRALGAISAALETADQQAATVADTAAAALARAVIEAMRAVMPDLIRRTALTETGSMLAQILPGLSREGAVRIEVPTEVAPYVETMLAPLAPEQRDKILITVNDDMRCGDAQVHWTCGHARRDPAAIWQTVMEALQPALDTPTAKDSDHDK